MATMAVVPSAKKMRATSFMRIYLRSAQTPNVTGTAPNCEIVAVKKLFGFFDSLRVIVAKQGLEADEVAVVPKGVNAIFWHNRSARR
jgi:hypothetical protein